MPTAKTDEFRMGRREFDGFRRLIREVSGISLGDNKDALLMSRVGKRMRALGLTDHSEYLSLVESDDSGHEMCLLIDAISTNVTSFFREPEHFERLSAHLTMLADEGRGEVRMWSAACATGEEPYSMAMIASDALSGRGVRTRILATDISGEALAKAKAGRYEAGRVAAVPRELASRHLRRMQDGSIAVTPQIRSIVSFARMNLSAQPFVMTGPFDTIMCRNVMIYFDRSTRQRLVAELERLLAPGGLLMLGHAESLTGVQTSLRSLQPAVYEKPGR